jgi:hypothetical protein
MLPRSVSRARATLQLALEAYRDAFKSHLRSHWIGIQQLALEAVLTGRLARPEDWAMVARVAEIAQDTIRGGAPDF